MSTINGAAVLTGAATLEAVPRELVVNAGSGASNRWTLTVTANAATVKFVNRAETEPALVITGLEVDDAVVVDGRERTVTVNATAAPDKVAPGSGWPLLQPGANDIRVTGGVGTLTYRPLYV